MNNPNGPYPGRQLFVGLTADGSPCLAYLVTGRSSQSRERVGTQSEQKVIMGPIGNQEYDPLRHYKAVKYDNASGIAVVSNGIQTEAIFETYKLLYNTSSPPAQDYMQLILDGAGAEPDSLHTPRIAAIVTSEHGEIIYIVGIMRDDVPAKAARVEPKPGMLAGISTYEGSLEKPEPFDPDSGLAELPFKGNTPAELAEYLFDISSADYNGDDIRVCAIGGVYSGDSRSWNLAVVNKHQP
jgi:IMP cyclohydrolase